MNEPSEDILNYIDYTDNQNLIRKHAINSKVVVEYYPLSDKGLHVSRVHNYSFCNATNTFRICHTFAYTNNKSIKYHKFIDGKILLSKYISNSNFYEWLAKNKAIIITSKNGYMPTNSLDPEVIALVKIIRKNRVREKNLLNICNLYNKISMAKKYAIASSSQLLKEPQTMVTQKNYLAIAYSLLEKEKQLKNLKKLLWERNAIIKINCQCPIIITNHSSILDGIKNIGNPTYLEIFLQKLKGVYHIPSPSDNVNGLKG